MQLRRRRPASSNSAPPHRPDQGLKTAALGLVERVAAAADGHQRAQRRGLRGGGRHLADLTWAGSSRRRERPTPRGRARPTPACRSAAGCPVRPSRRCSAPSTPARRLLGQRLLREPADLRPAALAPDALWVVQIFPRAIDTEPRSPRRHRRPAGRADGQPVAGAGGRRDRDDQPAGARRDLANAGYREVGIERIELDHGLDPASVAARSPSFLAGLVADGEKAGAAFLEERRRR